MEASHELFQRLSARLAKDAQFHHVHPARAEFVLGDLALAPPGPFCQIALRDPGPLTRGDQFDHKASVSFRTQRDNLFPQFSFDSY